MKREKAAKSDGKAELTRMRRSLKSLKPLTAEQMKMPPIGQESDPAKTHPFQEALMSGSDDYVIVLSRDGIILEANEAVARRFGMSRESLIGRSSLDFLRGQAREKRRRALETTVKTGRIFRFEDENAGRYFDHVVYPLKGVDGNVTKVVAIGRDVTPLKTEQKDGQNFRQRAIVNIMHLAKPCLEKMKKTALDETQKQYLSIIEMCLDTLIEPIQRDLSRRKPKLSAAELRVGSLVKFGMSTKQIAETLNLGAGTVQTYRRRIRKKLGISGKKVKLSSSL